MAATRLIAMHINKGHTIAQCLKARIDYAKNPEKTRLENYYSAESLLGDDMGELVTSYECDPMTVDEEFMLSKRLYYQKTGKTQKNDVIAYQIRQSFKPGEITPEEANRIGYELAMRFTKGDYAFIVATHTDRAHIHNHIIYNSTALDGTHKFKDFLRSGMALQRCSDILCLENGLSVIEPKPYSQRQKRTVYPKKESKRNGIQQDIDSILQQNPKSFEDFLFQMEQLGYEVKRGQNVSLKGKNQKRFIRLSSLENGYTEEDIRKAIEQRTEERKIHPEEGKAESGQNEFYEKSNKESNKASYKESHKNFQKPQLPDPSVQQQISLTIDIQGKLKNKGKGYQRWATVYNLKQMSKTLLFLRDHQIESLDQLNEMLGEKIEKRDSLLAELQTSEKRLKEIAELKTQIINYLKTREIYEGYRKSGYSKKYLEAHREEITLHKAAKAAFEKLDGRKLPKVKELSAEYASVLADKRKAYAEYKQIKTETQEYLIVQQNIASLYQAEEKEKEFNLNKEVKSEQETNR